MSLLEEGDVAPTCCTGLFADILHVSEATYSDMEKDLSQLSLSFSLSMGRVASLGVYFGVLRKLDRYTTEKAIIFSLWL